MGGGWEGKEREGKLGIPSNEVETCQEEEEEGRGEERLMTEIAFQNINHFIPVTLVFLFSKDEILHQKPNFVLQKT